jgi:hypothetical protein
MRNLAKAILSMYLTCLCVLVVITMADPPGKGGVSGILGFIASVIAGLPWSLFAMRSGSDIKVMLLCWLGALVNVFILCLVYRAAKEASLPSPAAEQVETNPPHLNPPRSWRLSIQGATTVLVSASAILLLAVIVIVKHGERSTPVNLSPTGNNAETSVSTSRAEEPSSNERAAGEEWALSEGATKPEQCTGSIYFVEGCVRQVKRASAGNGSFPP